jgi:hypothetical protein
MLYHFDITNFACLEKIDDHRPEAKWFSGSVLASSE